MADIIGRIGPQADVREAQAWTEPVRVIEISDASGRRHGRIEWLTSEVDEDFARALLELYATATRADAIPASASLSVS